MLVFLDYGVLPRIVHLSMAFSASTNRSTMMRFPAKAGFRFMLN